jgi:hypothetical protein
VNVNVTDNQYYQGIAAWCRATSRDRDFIVRVKYTLNNAKSSISGTVTFLEDDHYVSEDFLHVLHLAVKVCDSKKAEGCGFVSLGKLDQPLDKNRVGLRGNTVAQMFTVCRNPHVSTVLR